MIIKCNWDSDNIVPLTSLEGFVNQICPPLKRNEQSVVQQPFYSFNALSVKDIVWWWMNLGAELDVEIFNLHELKNHNE